MLQSMAKKFKKKKKNFQENINLSCQEEGLWWALLETWNIFYFQKKGKEQWHFWAYKPKTKPFVEGRSEK